MNKADCFNLGHVAKLHGYKGEVSLFFDVTNPDDYKNLDSVYIDLNNQLTPFFVEKITSKGKGFFQAKFENLNSDNEARNLLRKDLYLPLSLLPELGDKNFYDHEVVNFEVEDTNFGSVGKINQVLDYKINPLLQIMNGDTEVLIPLIDGLVQKVDRENKKLTITAPEGLIEMYLNE